MKPHLETYHCPWCGGLAFSPGPIQNGVFQEAVFCSRCGKPFSMLGRYERKPSFASTQFNLEGDALQLVRDMQDRIDSSDLASKGKEDEPHITVKYGLHSMDAGPVRELVEAHGPVNATIEGVDCFESDEHDVIILRVGGSDIHELNAKIAGLPHTDTHPTYKPHATIAYVKPGVGKRYVKSLGEMVDEPIPIQFKLLVFSPKGEAKTAIEMCSYPWAENGKFSYARIVRDRMRDSAGGILRYALKQVPAGKVITSNGKTYRGGQWVSEKLIGQAVDAPAKASKPTKKAADASASKAPGDKQAAASYHEAVKAKASAKKPSAKKADASPASSPKADAEPSPIDSLLAPHAGIELSPKERGNVKRSLAALKRHHGDNIVKRIGELASAAHQAMEAATSGPAKANLAKKLREYGEMMAAVRAESLKAGQLNEAVAELKPTAAETKPAAEETKQMEPETPSDAGGTPGPDVETIKKYIELTGISNKPIPNQDRNGNKYKERAAAAKKMESEHAGIGDKASAFLAKEAEFTAGEPKERPRKMTIQQVMKDKKEAAIFTAQQTGWMTDGIVLFKLSDKEKESVAKMETHAQRAWPVKLVYDKVKGYLSPVSIVGHRDNEWHDSETGPKYAIDTKSGPVTVKANLWEAIAQRFPDAKPYSSGGKGYSTEIAFKTPDGEVVGVLATMREAESARIKMKTDSAESEQPAEPAAAPASPAKASYAETVKQKKADADLKKKSDEPVVTESPSVAGGIAVGQMVKLKLPHATQGTMNAAGKVTRIMPDGRIEVRTQLHGYWTGPASELTAVEPTPAAVATPPASAPTVQPASAFDDLLGQLRAENPGKAIAIRVGDFYEFHGDDAIRAATALHTNAKDRKNLVTGITSPVLAIPHQAIDKMLTHLERAGVDVAVADLEAEMAETPNGAKDDTPGFSPDLPVGSIYKINTNFGERFAIRGESKNGFGDTVHKTKAEAAEQVERDKANAANRAEAAKKREEEEAKAKAARDAELDIDGYASDLTPMQRGRIIATLNTGIYSGGVFKSRKQHIRDAVSKGVLSIGKGSTGDDVLMRSDGRIEKAGGGYLENVPYEWSLKSPTTEVAYAKHLLSKAAFSPELVKSKEPWEMTKAEYADQEYQKWKGDRPHREIDKQQLSFNHFNPDHEAAVADAAHEGKSIPAEVLADYPDIQSGPPATPPDEPSPPPAKTDADHEQDYNAIQAQYRAEIARSHADWTATEKSFQARARGVGKNTQKYVKLNDEYLTAKQQAEDNRTAMHRKFREELQSHPFESIRRQRDQDAVKAKREAEGQQRTERIAQRAVEAKAAIASAQGTTKLQVVDAWFPTFLAREEKNAYYKPMSPDEETVFKANLLDSLSNLDKMIQDKDVKLGGMLHTRNPMFRDYFATVTGVALPKTEKGTTEALNAFIGQDKIDAIAAAKQAERQAKIDAAAKAKADARAALDTKYHGYTASMAPYMAATVDKNLSKPVRADGVNYASIRDFVESKLQAGYRVDNGRFKQADGRYYDAGGIGASAINYAAYRSGQIQKAEAVAKEVAAPETAKAPPVPQPLPPPVAPIKPITASTANRNDSFAQSVRDSVKLPPATPTPTFTWVDQQSAATDPAAQAARAATLKALRLNGFIANKYPFYRDGKSIRIGEGWVKTGPEANWDSFTNEEAVAELNRITQEQAENFNRKGSPLRYAHGINN